MLGLLVAAFVAPAAQTATEFDYNQRLLAVDYQWSVVKAKPKHEAAVPYLSKAIAAFLAKDMALACQQLDAARDTLIGVAPAAADAVTLRFNPPFAEPRSIAQLRVKWAYTPADPRPVRISVGNQSFLATPGRDLTLEVRPEQAVPELRDSPEAGVLVPVTVGDQPRSAYLSIVKGLRSRATNMLNSPQPEARFLASRVSSLADDASGESDRPLIQMLFTAEILDEGRQRLDQLEELPLVHSGTTDFRISFPASLRGKTSVSATVVIALDGAGSTENTFFEANGHGSAVHEASARGWIFASPKTSYTAAQNVLTWLRERRHLRIGRVLVIGHGLGGLVGLATTATLIPRPAAVALFSPSARSLPLGGNDVPIYMAWAKQDAPMMLPNIRALAAEVEAKRNGKVVELDACDHLMSPADGMAGAFRFFDSVMGR